MKPEPEAQLTIQAARTKILPLLAVSLLIGIGLAGFLAWCLWAIIDGTGSTTGAVESLVYVTVGLLWAVWSAGNLLFQLIWPPRLTLVDDGVSYWRPLWGTRLLSVRDIEGFSAKGATIWFGVNYRCRPGIRPPPNWQTIRNVLQNLRNIWPMEPGRLSMILNEHWARICP